MKKLSLMLVFVMILVAMLAFGVFAASSENVASDAELVLHDTKSDFLVGENLTDGDYHTACSAGSGDQDWINYRFYYDDLINVKKVRVILNSTGVNTNVGEYTELSKNNFTFYIRLYNVAGATVYNQSYEVNKVAKEYKDADGNVLYTYFEIEFETPYTGISQVEVPVVNNKNKNVCLWEVEIFDYTCTEENDHVNKEDDGNCTTPIVCKYCGTIRSEGILHNFDINTNLCTNEGCTRYFVPGCYDDYELGILDLMEKYYGDSEVKDEQGNYLGGYAGGGNNSFGAVFDNNTTNTGWAGGAAPRYNGSYNMTFFYAESHLIRNSTVYYYAHNENCKIRVEISNDGGETWEMVGEWDPEPENVGIVNAVKFDVNKGQGKMANAYRFTWVGGKYATFQVSVVEIDITASYVLPCSWNDGVETKAPTCAKEGVKLITCKSCGDSYEVPIPATGIHTYDEGEVTKPATDEEDGIKLYTCTVCGHTYEQSISAIQHTYVATVVPPTCTAKGYTVYTCTGDCGIEGCTKTYIDEGSYVQEAPHTYEEEVTIKPTALNVGEMTYTCSACGDSYTRPLDKLSWGTNTSVIGLNNIVAFETYYQDDVKHANADPAKLFDGVVNTTWAQNTGDGWFARNGSWLLITLDREYYVISVEFQLWANWCGGSIELLDVNGNKLKTFSSGSLQDTSGSQWQSASSLSEAVGVKYIKININSAKGNDQYGQCLAWQELRVTVHNHDREGDIENYVAPTCTDRGSYNETCSVCGLSYFVEIAALGHAKDGSAVVTDPTCVDQGYTTYNCTRCGEDFDDDYVNALGHAEGEAATCTESAICAVCGVSYGEPNGHTEGTAATCTEKAICSVCNEKYGEPNGHSFADATCTLPKICTVCSAVEGTALGHTAAEGAEGIVTEPTCTTEGYTTYTCSVCGENFNANTVPATGHNYVASEPAEDGSVVYACTDCDSTYTVDNAFLNGTYVFMDSPSLANGSFVFADGKLTITNDIGETAEYTYEYNATTQTLTTTCPFSIEYIEGTLLVRGQLALTEYIPPVELVLNENNAIEVTDTWNGTTVVVSVAGKYILAAAEGEENAYVVLPNGDSIDLPYTFEVAEGETATFVVLTGDWTTGTVNLVLTAQHEHSYTETVTPPTCTSEGYTTYTCACGDTYTGNTVEATGHRYAELKVTSATCTVNGYFTVGCGDCDYMIDSRVEADAEAIQEYLDNLGPYINIDVAAKGHTSETIPAVDATCTETGLTEGAKCSVCGEILVAQQETPVTHKWSEEADSYFPSTCTTAGYDIYLCTVCNAENKVDREINPNGHEADWSKDVTTEYANCTYDGYSDYTCCYCGELIHEVLQSNPDAHDSQLVDSLEATCIADGFSKYQCSICGAEEVYKAPANENAHVWETEGTAVEGGIEYGCTLCDATYFEKIYSLVVGENYIELPKVMTPFGFEVAGEITITITAPGKYTLTTQDAGIAVIVDNMADVIFDMPFVFEVKDGESITIAISSLNARMQFAVNVTLAKEEEPACEHTSKVEIPAEIGNPTDNKAGIYAYTSGVKCADCGTVLVEPERSNANFKINSASLTLSQDINVVYSTTLPEGYTDAYMVFTFDGKETIVYGGTKAGSRYEFKFAGLKFYVMNENINAKLYATVNGKTAVYEIAEYSVKTYCINQLKNSKTTDKLKTLISDLLYAGAATQIYENYKVNELVTDAVIAAGYTLTPSTYTDISADENVKAATNVGTDYVWKGAGLTIGNATFVTISFTATDIEGLEVHVKIRGTTEVFSGNEITYNSSSKRYEIKIDYLKAKQYGDTIEASFVKNGEKVGGDVTYSINSYLYSNKDSSNEKLKNLVRALYCFGKSVVAYEG